MAFTLGKQSPWDFTRAKPFYKKSFEENLNEIGVLNQITGVVIPEALAYKAVSILTPVAYNTATRATQTAVITQPAQAVKVASVTTPGAVGAGLMASSVIPLVTTGVKVGGAVYAMEWLKKYWYIPALLLGGYIGLKYVEKKRRF